jgi:hypothetical protein
MIKKGAYLGLFVLFISIVISCEKDFQDVASNVVSNTKFETKDTIIEIEVTNKQITNVRGDGLSIGGTLGQYLLGVYNNPNYEKIEASTISQLALDVNAKLQPETYGADTTVVTTIDTVFLKIPYQATLKSETTSDYTLDSIIGDQSKAFTLNVYRTDTYLNRLNPNDPAKINVYNSDHTYQILPGELNAEVNYQFIPNKLDTIFVYKRRLSNGTVYKTDTVKLTSNNPFARIALDKAKIKQIFVDEYGTSKFETQEAFNEYFKGLYIQATGNEGSLMAFNVATTNFNLKPSLEIKYTKTVLKGGTTIVDTLEKTSSYLLSNFTNSLYKMDEKVHPTNENVIVQGTAGNMATVKLLDATKLNALRAKQWLINDATVTFYVNKNIIGNDTTNTPYNLLLFKDGIVKSHIKDLTTEGTEIYGGKLILDSNRKPDFYSFKITDYISDLLSGETEYNPILGLKVLNSSDIPTSPTDTIVANHSWNPKAVTLLNHLNTNGARRAQLKISYTIKK